MRLNFNKKQAFAFIEYLMFIVVFLVMFASFQSYIRRALNGQYRKAGESFAFGRQHSAPATIKCAYNDQIDTWYSVPCFNNKNLVCKTTRNLETCEQASMSACRTSACE
ncbi:MAG: hypothetical protein V2A70_04275 [Candidatus Omnitrophota bacterium]